MNEIYFNSKKLDYNDYGIKNLNLNIHSNINTQISLKSIFKLINSTLNLPMIKYNPGKKLENIYRLFCDKIQNTKKNTLFN